MSTARPAACLAALLILAGWAGATLGSSAEREPAASLLQTETPGEEPLFEYTGLTFDDLDSKRLRLKFHVQLRSPKNNLMLLRMTFENVTANDLPLVIEPYEGTVELKTDELVQLPAPLHVVLYFRELNSLESLRRLLETRQVRLRGTADITMKFKGVEGVFTLGQNLNRSVPFEKVVPVDLLDHPLARPLTQMLLGELANPKSAAGTAWLEQQLQLQALRQRGEDMGPGLVLIETRYRILDAGGTPQRELDQRGLGFFIAPDRVVTTKRVLEPWKYLPELAFLQQNGYQVELAGYDITLGSAGGTAKSERERSALRLTYQQIQVQEKPEDEMVAAEYESPTGKVAVQVHRLDSPQGLVLLRTREKKHHGTPLPRAVLLGEEESLLGIAYLWADEESGRVEGRTRWALARTGPEGLMLDRRLPDSFAGAPVFDVHGQVRAIFVGEDRCLPVQSLNILLEGKP